jgi:ABC-type glycerol-3-phosphate transport system substrate-binding protein
LLLVAAFGCSPRGDGKVHITYWEKWGGREGAAMQTVVDQFNASQDRIVVEYLPVAQVDRKVIVATAGGDPPDVAGLWANNLYSFIDRNALLPLDDFIRAEGITSDQWLSRYVPVYGDITTYRDKTWCIISTPSTTALHWNKRLFREAGFDPDRPPRTLAELDEFAAKLTKRDAAGKLVQVGFLPQEPGWFHAYFPQWFGGRVWDGTNITFTGVAENLECYRWVSSYTERFGLDQVRSFASGFGSFSSPQNPFMAGKVAMVFQGVWMNNYLQQYAPGLEYGVAPWPAVRPGLENFTFADADLLAIPRGAKHPREAWEFIKFVAGMNPHAQTREQLRGGELLCYLQQKNSPLREWSPFFEKHHPHPHIALFRSLAESPNAIHPPKVGIWQEYTREIRNVFDISCLLIQPPAEAMAFCQQRIAGSWTWHQRSIQRRP